MKIKIMKYLDRKKVLTSNELELFFSKLQVLLFGGSGKKWYNVLFTNKVKKQFI